MPLILPGNVASATAGAFSVDNSCRFDGSSSSLTKAQGASPSSNLKGTFSMWLKKSNPTADQHFLNVIVDTNNRTFINFTSDSELQIAQKDGGAGTFTLISNAKYKDPAAWMNLVVAFDTAQGSASNRIKAYMNGTQITSWSTETYPDQNTVINLLDETPISIGAYNNASHWYDGYMAQIIHVNNQALTPTSFGEFDEDSPTIWKPIDISGLTVATNGYFLDFADSANLGNDAAGGTDFTENNIAATDSTTDTPTNNFATANPLNVNSGGPATFAEGNTEVTSPTATGIQFMSSSTLGMTAGKYYCEAKIITVDSLLIGVSANVAEDARDDAGPGWQGGAQSVGILASSGNKYIDDSGSTHGAATSADGIMMIALDLDNNNVYFGTGGNWFDGSGNADESNPTSAISVTAVGSTTDGAYFFTFGDGGGSSACKVQWNFGNPPFSISSGNSDANGYGNFEYSVPSGYLSLCTKNLGSDGG